MASSIEESIEWESGEEGEDGEGIDWDEDKGDEEALADDVSNAQFLSSFTSVIQSIQTEKEATEALPVTSLAASGAGSVDQIVKRVKQEKDAREAKNRLRLAKRQRNKVKLRNLLATLLGRLGIMIKINKQCDEEQWQKKVLRLVPDEIQAIFEKSVFTGCQKLLPWIRSTFRRQVDIDTSQQNRHLPILSDEFLQRKLGSEIAVAQTILCITRYFCVPSRLVCRFTQQELFEEDDVWLEFLLEPPQQVSSLSAQQIRSNDDSPTPQRRWYRVYGTTIRIIQADEEEQDWSKTRTVDPTRKKGSSNNGGLDCFPRRFENKKTTLFIAAIGDSSGHLTNVTPRYSSKLLRPNSVTKFFDRIMRDWNSASATAIPAYAVSAYNEQAQVEEINFFASLQSIEICMPTSVEAFSKSADYVLESALGSASAVEESAKPVNFYRGQAVFKRSEIMQLHNEWGWKKLGRMVKKDELDSPKKILPKKAKVAMSAATATDNNSSAAATAVSTSSIQTEVDEDGEELVDPRRKLYSENQTDPVDPGEIDHASGKIPTNEYGNVELWCDAWLPRGTFYIDEEDATEACKALEIIFVPAVVGFEWKNGRARPKYDGIVVAERDALIVKEKIAELQEQRRKDIERQHLVDRARKWRELLDAYWLVMNSTLGHSHPQATPKAANPSTATSSTEVMDATNPAISESSDVIALISPQMLNRLTQRGTIGTCEHSFKNGSCIYCNIQESDVEYL